MWRYNYMESSKASMAGYTRSIFLGIKSYFNRNQWKNSNMVLNKAPWFIWKIISNEKYVTSIKIHEQIHITRLSFVYSTNVCFAIGINVIYGKSTILVCMENHCNCIPLFLHARMRINCENKIVEFHAIKPHQLRVNVENDWNPRKRKETIKIYRHTKAMNNIQFNA